MKWCLVVICTSLLMCLWVTGFRTHYPCFLFLAHSLFVFITFFYDCLLFIKLSIKALRFNCLFRSSLPYKGSCVTTSSIKCVCSSLVNLSFASTTYRAQVGEPKISGGQDIYSLMVGRDLYCTVSQVFLYVTPAWTS